jgi:gliding motility-associated-like protein
MKYTLRLLLVSALFFMLGAPHGFASQCVTYLVPRVNNTSDCGASDGSIVFNGVTPNNTYTVDYTLNSIPQPTLTITPTTPDLVIPNLVAGQYDNFVINNTAQFCVWGPLGVFTVYDPIPLIDSVWSIDPAPCGSNTGSIFLNGLTPATTYTINYSLNGNPQPAVTGITDANGMIIMPAVTSGGYDITVQHGTCVSNSVNINLYDPVFAGNYDYAIHLGCTADTVVFQNESENTTNVLWDFGDNSNSTNLSPTHVYTAQGVYTVVLHTYNGSCEKITTHEITLVHPVVSSFTAIRDSICEHQTVNFNGSASTNAYRYVWDFGDGRVDSTNKVSVSHTYNTPGTYAAALTVFDFVPCPDRSVHPIMVAPFEIHALYPDTSVCIYKPMRIENTLDVASYVSQPLTFAWSPADFLDSDSVQQPHFYAEDTQYHTYVVTMTSAAPFNCVTKDTVRVFAQPHVHLANVTPTQVIHYGSTAHLNADGGYYYHWEPAQGLDNANIKDPITMPLEPTIYTVYAMNEYGGCRDSATIKVDLVNDQEFIPSAFTPNFDGKNDEFKIVNMRSQRLLEFRVYDRWGQKVFETKDPSQGWDGNYNGKAMDSGVYSYIIHVAMPDGTQTTYRGNVTLLR